MFNFNVAEEVKMAFTVTALSHIDRKFRDAYMAFYFSMVSDIISIEYFSRQHFYI